MKELNQVLIKQTKQKDNKAQRNITKISEV